LKTINFLTGNFVPENCAGTNRILSLVNKLEKKYKINIFCITERGKPQKNSKIKFTENIDVYYIDQKFYDGEKFYTRAIYEFYYAIKLALKSRKLNSDLTIATSPQMFIIPACSIFIQGKKIIDVRDLVWEYIEVKTVYRKLMKMVIANFMKLTLKQYTHITVTNNHELNWIRENVKNSTITKITNGIEEKTFLKLNKLEPKPKRIFTITYIGNVGIAQNIETLIEAAKELKNIQVNIVGDGSRYNALKSYVHKNRVLNVEFFGRVARGKMIDFYQESSLLFAQLDEKFKAAMPSKLYEYASTGLPIIYAGVGEARSFVDKLENCTTIDPRNSKQLINAIKKYLDADIKISERNRNFIKENFIRETQSLKLVDLVDNILIN